MNVFGVAAVRKRLSELVGRAFAGEEIVITKRGRPVARILAYSDAEARDERRVNVARSLDRVRTLCAGLASSITMADILGGRHSGHKY
jgi:prevent-host-death family protein